MDTPPIDGAGDGVVDLATPPPESPTDETPSSLTSLAAIASAVDSHPSIPSFLNELLAPLFPHPSVDPEDPPDILPLEKALNDLSTRFSLLSSDTSSALEQSIQDISRTVPRLTYDLQFMRESATSLQSSLSLVRDRVARQTSATAIKSPKSPKAGEEVTNGRNGPTSVPETEEAKTHRSLEKLAHLDLLKSRMESARDILREAESWSTLEAEVQALVESQSFTKAGERLAEASRSMVVFQNTPGEFESKKTLLVSLQNELETSLSAALKEAIAKVDVEGCARFYGIFEMMEREQEFRNYYFSARRAGIVAEWEKAALLESGSVEEGVKCSVFLPTWYASVLATISTERNQIPQIFLPSMSQSILASFLQTTFDVLNPSLQSRLSTVADYHGASALPELIRLFRATEELGFSVQGSLDKLAFNTQGGLLSGSALATSPSPNPVSPTAATTPDKDHPPKSRGKRLSVSRRFSRAASSIAEASSGPSTSPTPWEITLYEPFLDFQTAYASFERRYLTHILQTDPSLNASTSGRSDAARILSERSQLAFTLAEEAIGRCVAFTHGYGAKGLVDALNGFIEGFLDANQQTILQIASRGTTANGSGPDDLDVVGLDYSTEDWGSFQLGLHILTTCRDVQNRLHAFEDKLTSALVDMATTLRSSALPVGRETTMGAMMLLQQSPLNSAELQGVLSRTSSYTLLGARDGLTSLTRASQSFLQDIILSPLRRKLDAYPSLSVWAQPDKAPRRGELPVPTFSLSPTDTILRVTEGLHNLLGIFEVYAKDDALGFSVETLPFVDGEAIRAMQEEDEKASEAENPLLSPANSTTPKETSGSGEAAPYRSITQNGSSTNGETKLSPEAVLSTWISSLALGLLSYLTSKTLPSIKSLSNAGAAQLSSDLGYLSNAVRALDVEWEELERWKEVVGKDEEAWKGEVKDKGDVWRRVGRMRGWQI